MKTKRVRAYIIVDKDMNFVDGTFTSRGMARKWTMQEVGQKVIPCDITYKVKDKKK